MLVWACHRMAIWLWMLESLYQPWEVHFQVAMCSSLNIARCWFGKPSLKGMEWRVVWDSQIGMGYQWATNAHVVGLPTLHLPPQPVYKVHAGPLRVNVAGFTKRWNSGHLKIIWIHNQWFPLVVASGPRNQNRHNFTLSYCMSEVICIWHMQIHFIENNKRKIIIIAVLFDLAAHQPGGPL